MDGKHLQGARPREPAKGNGKHQNKTGGKDMGKKGGKPIKIWGKSSTKGKPLGKGKGKGKRKK